MILNWLWNFRAFLQELRALVEEARAARDPGADTGRGSCEDDEESDETAGRGDEEQVADEQDGARDDGADRDGTARQAGPVAEAPGNQEPERAEEAGGGASPAAPEDAVADAPAAEEVGDVAEEVREVEPILFVGSDPAELIEGDLGNDELYGGRGNDTIEGRAGADYLSGNQGNDVLIGGKGADVFSFDGDFDRDVVTDFSLDDGDRLDFIFYAAEQDDWTAETVLDLFVQDGTDAVLNLAGSDEEVVLREVDVAELTPGLISVTSLYDGPDLIA